MDPILQQEYVRLEKKAGGRLSVSALHLGQCLKIDYKGDETFLLYGMQKLILAVCLLYHVEKSHINLYEEISITKNDLRIGSASFMNELDFSIEIKLSVMNLLIIMIRYNCNTCADLILKLMGGPNSIMSFLADNNIQDLRIDRTVLEFISAWDGVENIPSDKRITLSEYLALKEKVPEAIRQNVQAQIKCSTADKGSVNGIIHFIQKLYTHKMIGAKYVELILGHWQRKKEEPSCFVNAFPDPVELALVSHSFDKIHSSLCLITLPEKLGTMALSIVLQDTNAELGIIEKVIAEVMRTTYDYYLFNSLNSPNYCVMD